MDNRCFIIMPQGEPSGYSQGHFNRVYDYVIVPACRAAGFWPVRAESDTYDNPLEVIKKIIDSDIVLCDLSANNANALYGLAVRHSLDLPVTLVKDTQSVVLFNATEFGAIVYDESLRIDTVQKATEVIGDALRKAVDTKKERHQLLDRLSIGLLKFETPVVEFTPTPVDEPIEQIEEPKPKSPALPIISPLPNYVGEAFTEAQIERLKVGDSLFHLNYGRGKLTSLKGTGKDKLAGIQFDSGSKMLVISASDLFRRVKD